ncbi:D-Ala-D-Ala carboxypeptidase family metallohydrolase [Prevotella sp. FD3004]|uniref:D-Ala-D-Ala carboxypeptidase family metallohydrolase n=1 Tax=Prevotella sp. FD3004 TaxID=1408309 RepID=UPI00068C9FE0|nr:D-Ala-D-Ala carboxypeptidase family metallohydrolase [Prevotella sp. FD3004]
MNKTNLIRLSEHFTLAELCKTSHTTATGNTPPPAAINNLKNLCDNWLEPLRHSYNTRYGDPDEPLIISSGYRSPEVNRKAGGSPTSNHTTGCAVDIRCLGLEQAIRYAAILLDLADTRGREFKGAQASEGSQVSEGSQLEGSQAPVAPQVPEGTLEPDFDELFIERSSRGTYWLHLAVRPTANRHKTAFVQT